MTWNGLIKGRLLTIVYCRLIAAYNFVLMNDVRRHHDYRLLWRIKRSRLRFCLGFSELRLPA